MAAETSSGEAYEYDATVDECFEGSRCVRIVEVLICDSSLSALLYAFLRAPGPHLLAHFEYSITYLLASYHQWHF
jgi:hypothetical protein